MAVVTGGTYVRSVAGDMDLDAIYTDEIRRKMEAETLSSGRKQVWEDRFQWPLAIALLCLVAELMLARDP
jgi:Ca-activated chloride channel family protein